MTAAETMDAVRAVVVDAVNDHICCVESGAKAERALEELDALDLAGDKELVEAVARNDYQRAYDGLGVPWGECHGDLKNVHRRFATSALAVVSRWLGGKST